MEKFERLETLYQVNSFISFYLQSASCEASKKEWSDKLEANQKEIDSILNPR